ncbi:allantoicase, partial [Streptomyces calidiresistens]|nr:allantoicase [Streptomyces calidiresistens]
LHTFDAAAPDAGDPTDPAAPGWRELLPATRLEPDTVHRLLLPWLAALGTFDLLAAEHGGRVEDASDRFYSPPGHTLLPGRPDRMDQGWETRRRRDRGHDWIRYALPARARIRAVEIDTGRYRGNAPGWARLHTFDAAAPDAGDPTDPAAPGWRELLPATRLEPDTVHRLLLP